MDAADPPHCVLELSLRATRHGRYNVRMRWLAILLALLSPSVALGGDGGLQALKQRYLPPVQAAYANTPDGAQARYNAGRDLVEAVVAVGPVGRAERELRADLLARGRAQVARAEALDRDVGFRSLGPAGAAAAGDREHRPSASRRDAGTPARGGRRVGERRRRDLGARPEQPDATRATSPRRASRRRRR